MIVGVGIDLLEVERMEKAIARSGGRLLARIFTADERASCEALGAGAARWAARFAAKEAVFKALGTGWGQGVGWHDVEILRSDGGRPEIRLHGAAHRAARRKGAVFCHVSLTHERSHAGAMAVLESDGGAGA